jgi:hypothetical protein
LGLAIDFEFPQIKNDQRSENNGASNNSNNNKSKKYIKPQATIPNAIAYQMPSKLEARLKILGRKINIYSRINIKIKQSDINNYLHHLVLVLFMIYFNLVLFLM